MSLLLPLVLGLVATAITYDHERPVISLLRAVGLLVVVYGAIIMVMVRP